MVGGKSQAGANFLGCQVGGICQNLRPAHPAGQVIDNTVDGGSQASDTGISAAFLGSNRDAVAIVHVG